MAMALNVIKDEHRSIAAVLHGLQELVRRIRERGDKIDPRVFPEFAGEVERFVEGYWEHMRKEEEHVFPLAAQLFTPSEWDAIDRAFAANTDPLAGDRNERDFRRLFSRIVSLAPPPIGVGPASR